ncbi:MAG TPA: radical SAM protein [Nanoarchaeota archaeon]|nr:radical SAM protein [Nanoarchaeota archaeon]
MAEVVLIYIHHKGDNIIVPLGTLYIGTYLQKYGFGTRVFNFIIDGSKHIGNNDLSRLKQELQDCLCVGFSVMTTQVAKSLALSKLIKSIKPEIKIVWGGTHPSLFPEQTLQNENIDFAIQREGEKPMLELVRELKNKKNRFGQIKGLSFKEKNKIKHNPAQPLFEEFEGLTPDWGMIAEFVKQNRDVFICGNSYKYVEIHTGRGCPYRCNFCINNIVFGKTRRARPISSVIEEIKAVTELFHPTLIKMRDENFFIDRKYIEAFCDKLKEEKIGLKWVGNCRVNYFDNYDDAFMQKIKESGCVSLAFGAESGSRKILGYLKKDILPEQIYKSAEKCIKYGIMPVYSFMIGLPNETKADLLQTLDLIKRMKQLSNKVGFTLFQIIRPYPGGELYVDCLKYGIYEPKTLEEWEHKSKISLHYLDPKDLPWIKNPDEIEVVAKYASRGLNNYLLELNINPAMKWIFALRTSLFYNLSYSYVKTDNLYFKKLIKLNLCMVEAISDLGKSVSKKFVAPLKKYK